MPVNIHSWQWLWLSNKAFEKAGVPVPKNWDEFVAAAPALEKAGNVPLAVGEQAWQTSGAFDVLMAAIGGTDIFLKVYKDKDAKVAAGPEVAKVFKAADDARKMAAKSNVQDWNQATNLVITGKAGGQIMGDWAQGEFQVAGQVAGKDYTCLPGLGAERGHRDRRRRLLLPEAQGSPTRPRRRKCWPRRMLDPEDAGRLQPQEGLAAGARRRRSHGGQRLHEEGPRDPRQGQRIPWTDQLISAGYEPRDERSVCRVLQHAEHDGRGRAEALRRHHRHGRLKVLPWRQAAGRRRP